jgi:hypothetical protein
MICLIGYSLCRLKLIHENDFIGFELSKRFCLLRIGNKSVEQIACISVTIRFQTRFLSVSNWHKDLVTSGMNDLLCFELVIKDLV